MSNREAAAASERPLPNQLPSLRWDGHEVWGDLISLDAARKALLATRAPQAVRMPSEGQIKRLWDQCEGNTAAFAKALRATLEAEPTMTTDTPAAAATTAERPDEGWHAPGIGEVHNADHSQMIYCCKRSDDPERDGADEIIDDALARRVCAALSAPVAAQPAEKPIEFDMERMERALASPRVQLPSGLTPEQKLDFILASAQPSGVDALWVELTDEDRKAVFDSLDGGLDGFLKTWGWLHFAKGIEAKCREKNEVLSTALTGAAKEVK
jgi:hypothetical protein